MDNNDNDIPTSTFIGESYFRVPIVRTIHSVPRFGSPRDMVLYFNGADSEKDEYVRGLRLMSVILWIFLGLWVLVVVCCRKRRQAKVLRRCNWMVGSPPVWFQYSALIEKDGPLLQNRFQKTLKWCRVVLLVCGTGIFLLSGFLIADGFRELSSVIESGLSDLDSLNGTFSAAMGTMEQYFILSNETSYARDQALWLIGDNCNLSSSTFDPIKDYVNATLAKENVTAADAMQIVNGTLEAGTVIDQSIHGLYEELQNLTMSIEGTSVTLSLLNNWWMWFAVSLILVADLLVLNFMVGTILAWRRKSSRLFHKSSRVTLPTLTILVFISYMTSTICLMLSTFLSDLCIDDPNVPVEQIINAGDPLDEFVTWYLNGCMDEDRPDTLISIYLGVADLANAVSDGLDRLAEIPTDEVDEICDNGILVKTAIRVVNQRFDTLLSLVASMIDTLRCEVINPVYTHFTYDTTCHHGLRSSAAISLYLFSISCCCLVILTVRVAWQEEPEIEQNLEDLLLSEEIDENEASMHAPTLTTTTCLKMDLELSK